MLAAKGHFRKLAGVADAGVGVRVGVAIGAGLKVRTVTGAVASMASVVARHVVGAVTPAELEEPGTGVEQLVAAELGGDRKSTRLNSSHWE